MNCEHRRIEQCESNFSLRSAIRGGLERQSRAQGEAENMKSNGVKVFFFFRAKQSFSISSERALLELDGSAFRVLTSKTI